LEAVFAAAVGEDCVFEGEFAKDGNWGEEAQGCVGELVRVLLDSW
jgi:hypothetical protein